jgi:hypothetical protein
VNPDPINQPTLNPYSVTVYYISCGEVEESIYFMFAISESAVVDAMKRIYCDTVIQSIIFN